MEYTEVDIRVNPVAPFADILVARLNEIEFESYNEDETGVKTYVQTHLLDENAVEAIIAEVAELCELSYTITKVKQENWNEQWENNFDPAHINERCVIRAHFHNAFPDIEHEIIITPKMSFGTGHHDTTSLVMNEMFGIDFQNKTALDMGSGTGVLAILAAKLGASSLIGIDFDEWAFENAQENAKLNAVDNIDFIHGDADAIGDATFDIILANINRNIILQNIETYVGAMNINSEILFSGFLKEDIPLILEKSEQLGLELVVSKHKNKWQMLHFKKA
ncbi:MAG: 50S ribosomal protein L11 methyltransferase [Flavobacteriales bacterium]|jgi:ribosomal protein L11 methyltransferase|nr:50S ribosomal protein L11 methyltransferase [Flavobacteriales bacterium]MBT5090231.1 50S ribosomal protein L11 methyltransferase [Flavobacteriales bacterium]MBT5750154.1 50S ribosomal protein L11 methyltransferase [Flavobacteriales bacterium]